MNIIEIPPKIKYRNKKIEINGLKLNYWEEGSGPKTLLFIHGFTGNVEEWYFQFEFFKKDYKVIAIDLRGHGFSEISQENFGIGDLSSDINRFLEKKGISEIILIGHSMGGMVAQHFALNHPDKVEKLVLVSTTPGGPPRKIPESYIDHIRSVDISKLITEMSRFASIPLEKIAPERREFYKKIQKWSVERRGKGISKDVYISYLEKSSNFDLRDKLCEIKVPTLILCGEKDQLIGNKRSNLLKERIPNSDLVIFSECGHAPQREYFEQFNKILSEFLSK